MRQPTVGPLAFYRLYDVPYHKIFIFFLFEAKREREKRGRGLWSSSKGYHSLIEVPRTRPKKIASTLRMEPLEWFDYLVHIAGHFTPGHLFGLQAFHCICVATHARTALAEYSSNSPVSRGIYHWSHCRRFSERGNGQLEAY